MKLDRGQLGRLALVVALVLVLFGILTVFFWDFVRETIAIPIYYLLWVGNLTLQSIPQQAYLAVLLIISVVIALNTLRNVKLTQPRLTAVTEQQGASSRYIFWQKLATGLHSSAFAREQFVREARKLILSVLAYQEGVSEAEVDARVRDGMLDLPNAVRNMLQRQGLQITEPPPTTFRMRLTRWRDQFFNPAPARDPQIDKQVDDIVKFIEEQLELNYARN